MFEVLRVKKCSSKRLPPFDYYRTANWLTLVLIYFKVKFVIREKELQRNFLWDGGGAS